MTIEINDRIICKKMPGDSNFTRVIGTVVGKRNGYLLVDAEFVTDIWDSKQTLKPVENLSVGVLENDATSFPRSV